MNRTLPKDWEIVILGDVAEEVREYEKTPAKKGIERIVGLEHIDPENLRIHRWGLVANGTSFSKIFKKGQVLFGRRRAYQKKIAIADFDGICSGDILVFQTKEGMTPELLPFLMQSENFYNYALDTSAGSLSPRTKWKHLAKFEFPLPPIVKQKRIAEVLWEIENSIWKTEDTIGVAERYKKSLMKHLFMYGLVSTEKSKQMKMKETPIGLIPFEWNVQPMGELGHFSKGKGISKKDYLSEGVPCIPYGEIYTIHNTIIREFRTYISKTVAKKSTEIHRGDLLFTGSGETADEIGKTVAYLEDTVAYAGGDVIVFTPANMNSTYLSYYLNSTGGLKQKKRYGQGSSIVHIYSYHLKKIFIPIPPKIEQNSIAQVLETYYPYVSNVQNELDALRELKNHLINYLLFPYENTEAT